MSFKTQTTRAFRPEELQEKPRDGGAMLLVIAGPLLGEQVDLGPAPLVIGRSSEAHFRIPHEGVSRQHCRIQREESGYRLYDLGATNKTLLNGETVDTALLIDGDRVKLGDTVLKFFDRGSLESDYQQALVNRAAFDDLTQLYNRRQFIQHLARAMDSAKLRDGTLIMLMGDLDHFKPVNDQHGHLTGDEVLRAIARLIREGAPPHSEAGRLGGEEFAILLRDSTMEEGLAYAEKLREDIATLEICTRDKDIIHITCSFGMAGFKADMDSYSALLKAADIALYEAKEQGRNRVVVAT